MSNPFDDMKHEDFCNWLVKEPWEYSDIEIDKLWNEFEELYPEMCHPYFLEE